ncbi:hypothetical protein EWM64_g9966 [Hericium alpestre]|uniref:F-box domain-containing protein n=1 Tax=Hericium alpestre TaxID=135208 RepID=A0A4Y9ZHZ6_9AGAM|nr:hypothetical protein EWM64_g9966 [Hericium alpestre]
MVPSLPIEIIVKIIENTYHLHTDPPKVDIKTLSACAAVCKRWHRFARGLLFFKVDGAQDALMYFRLLAGPGGLGTCVRSLDLDVYRVDLDVYGVSTEPVWTMALSYCPNLYELCLDVPSDAPELTELEVIQLKALRLRIRALTFTLHGMQGELCILYQLMAIWPSIQFLTVSMLPGPTPRLPGERPPFSLYELTLSTFRLLAEPIMRWLLPPIPAGQKGSLHILSFTTGADQDLNALMEYMPYVRSLRILFRHPLPQGFLERCSALEELIFDVSDVAAESPDPKALVLPATIEHLRITGVYGAEVEPFAMAFTRSTLPRLQQVSINTYEMPQLPQNRYIDLSKVCSDRGVALVADSPGGLSWTSEYPVPVDHFPRDRTIENLYRMNIMD